MITYKYMVINVKKVISWGDDVKNILNLDSIEILDIISKRVVIVDSEYIIVYMSSAYCEFLNVFQDEVIGKKVMDVVENTRLDKVIESRVPEYAQLQNIKGKNMIATRIPIIKDGNVIGALGYVNYKDTSEFKALYNKISSMEKQLNCYKSSLKNDTAYKYSFESIIGDSTAILKTKELAAKAATTNSTVLLLGESGTGKEIFAHAIHSLSNRSSKPFIRVNCSAIPRELLESELFGYEKGAFTGANRDGKIGKFELANNGTIFLDEIGDMPLFMQAKILRVIQEKEVERIGSNIPKKLNIRIIAGTHRDLEAMVEEKSFRHDLFYRLNVIRITLPPLREREGDVEILSKYFVDTLSTKLDRCSSDISMDVLRVLTRYNWPGNVRQLQNTIERCLNLVDDGEVITLEHIPREIKNYSLLDDINSLDEEKDNIERSTIYKALLVYNNNKSLVARKLGISRVTLYEKIKKYNIKI